MSVTVTIRLSALIVLASVLISSCSKSGEPDYLDGESWRRQGLEDIIPFWQANSRDTINGAYYLNIDREGRPAPPWDKHPAMISRDVFGFTSAYLLSGEEKYIETAREGVEYLLKQAWDSTYGGWYDLLKQDGTPAVTSKTVPNQLYTNVGLSLYYFATGDERVSGKIIESINIQKSRAEDIAGTGYFQSLLQNLDAADSSKSKHSHYGYTSSLLINMMMITHDKEIRRFAEELMDISFARMRDSVNGWFLGFPGPYDRNWKIRLPEKDGREVVSAGGQLTAILANLRLYELTGNERYKSTGIMLDEKLDGQAYDSARGCWFDIIYRDPPHEPADTSLVYWWLQSYGMLAQLHLYNITGNRHYLETYKDMAKFWNSYFIDKEYGGSYLSVSASGAPVNNVKATAWKACYHEMENALLNYLYLNLYVNRKPAKLYFHFGKDAAGGKHFMSLLEDSSVKIKAVAVNGENWKDFNPEESSITIPGNSDMKIEVTYQSYK